MNASLSIAQLLAFRKRFNIDHDTMLNDYCALFAVNV